MRPLGVAGGLGHPGPVSDLLVTWLPVDSIDRPQGPHLQDKQGGHMILTVLQTPPKSLQHHQDIQDPSPGVKEDGERLVQSQSSLSPLTLIQSAEL